jgi:hypothetical protein
MTHIANFEEEGGKVLSLACRAADLRGEDPGWGGTELLGTYRTGWRGGLGWVIWGKVLGWVDGRMGR